MSVVQQLFDLLGVDNDIEKHNQAIASIENALADNRRLLEVQRAVEETQAKLKAQETQRQDIEIIVQTFQEKAQQLETTLYGGTIRNPRELQDMQKELTLLLEQLRQQEESLLLVLEAVEETQSNLGLLGDSLQTLQAERKQEQEQLLAEKARLQGASAELEAKRQSIASLVNPEHIRLYNSLRSGRQGQAVAKVQRGICQGCRLSLPTRVVQLARSSQQPVQCPSCSRILYVS